MVECLWGLVMRQSMGNKYLIFSHMAGEARKFGFKTGGTNIT